jgi:hypothetical protein
MYQQANDSITHQGLSLGARIFLGSVSALFGAAMFAMAAPPHTVEFSVFGAFCMFIALACFTRGRLRQFIGSCIGTAIFLAGLWYLGSEISEGPLASGRRSEPSVLNALLYLFFIGIPGAAYAYKARFGFAKSP